jgi:glycosyltransferase involved in cell wall biosynthesis
LFLSGGRKVDWKLENRKPRLLYIGDGPTHPGEDGRISEWVTGFAQVSKALALGLHERGFEVHLLGLNYTGDPHGLPIPLYCPSSVQRDLYGITRALELCQRLKPDVVFINNDLWICEAHFKHLTKLGDAMPAIVCYVPTDAEGYRPVHVAWLHRAHELLGQGFRIIPYSYFGKKQWQNAGYWRTSAPIGHGLDPIYKGRDVEDFMIDGLGKKPLFWEAYTWEDIQNEKIDARIEFAHGGIGPETFVIVNNDRNSARKRLDVLVDAFCQFAARVKEKEGYLGGPTKDEWAAWEVELALHEHRVKEWEREYEIAKADLLPKVGEVRSRWKAAVGEVMGEGYDVNVELGGVFQPRMRPAPKPPEKPEWEKDPLVKLWLHTNMTEHYDLPDLLKQKFEQYCITEEEGEAIIMATSVDDAVSHKEVSMVMMRRIYLAADCYVKVAPEGFGLGSLEAASCGCSLVLPENTVHPELWENSANLVKCDVETVAVPGNLISHTPLSEDVAEALYEEWKCRKHAVSANKPIFDYATSDRFDWGKLVDRFVSEIEAAASGRKKEG